MSLDQLLVVIVFMTTIGSLIFSDLRPASIFSIAVLALLAMQQLSLSQVTHHFTNMGLITLILLLMASTAIDKTSLIKRLGRKIISASYARSYWQLFGLTFFSSSLLNNTAVVATLIGPIKQNQRHLPSKLLIPLSYAAILGGTVTLVGTSTNLIVNSFLVEHGQAGFKFWDFTLFGLSAGLACGVLMFFLTPLLPNIRANTRLTNEYFIEAVVEPHSELIGKTVEQNHLRNLPELFLVEIIRSGTLISPVTPDIVIEPEDKLIFSGNVQKVDSLQHIDGLTLFAQNDGLLRENLTEVVVSNRAQVIGKNLKQLGFRALFDAAVVAIRRDGTSLSGKLGEIKLQAGDFLLLATGPDFEKRHNITKNFFILSEKRIAKKLDVKQEWTTLIGFIAAIALSATSLISLPISLMFLIAILVLTDVTSNAEIKRNLPFNLILVIVGALSLATALENTGVIALITQWLNPLLLDSTPFVALVAVYIVTLILTELVTNNAAAALMFPFAFAISQSLGLPIVPFALAVAFAASASFMSPYGYQTNLLVFSATKYKYGHFLKIGLPISLMFSSIVLMLLGWHYDFF
jgi:di/tricarboxylate transporter